MLTEMSYIPVSLMYALSVKLSELKNLKSGSKIGL